jgi:hypothetical protein
MCLSNAEVKQESLQRDKMLEQFKPKYSAPSVYTQTALNVHKYIITAEVIQIKMKSKA